MVRFRAETLINYDTLLSQRSEYPNLCAGVWVGAQVDPLLVFVGAVSELGWG